LSSVVYHFKITSNHNLSYNIACVFKLFITSKLHQTTTCCLKRKIITCCLSLQNYIKPQHALHRVHDKKSCLSLQNYIKPQQRVAFEYFPLVVYHFKITSNHNRIGAVIFSINVVYHFKITSNHNKTSKHDEKSIVVYHFKITSNHNVSFFQLDTQIVVYHFKITSNHNLLRASTLTA